MVWFWALPLLLLGLTSTKVHSQTFDSITTQNLSTVEVSTWRLNWSQQGKRVLRIDTLLKMNNQFQSLSDVLSTQSPVFIKSYGPGALASSSLRGGSASQTAVLWNGFNINHPMLGQLDFSQLPSFLFDKVELEMGASSALHGSGVINGSIQLSNVPKYTNTIKAGVALNSGSFTSKKVGAFATFSTYRFNSSTRFYKHTALNNFLFMTDSNTTQRQSHNAFASLGFVQDLSVLLNARNKIEASVWYNQFSKQLPNSFAVISKASQFDENTRASFNWTNFNDRYRLSIRQGIFSDELNYTDSLLPIFSKSKCFTSTTEAELNTSLNAWSTWFIGFQYTHQNVNSSNYKQTQTATRAALVSGLQVYNTTKKIVLSTTLRQEQSSLLPVPLTGQMALELKPMPQWQVKLSSAKVYRLPTLNDWYWLPGGNPRLKPEEGYSSDACLIYSLPFQQVTLQITGSVFYKTIHNWILWLPKANFTSPDNVLKVRSRGAETQTELKYVNNKFYVYANVQTTYVLSTVEDSYLKDDASLGKQLIYTPRYAGNGTFTLGYKQCALVINHAYTGYRFSSSDHSSWLKPYHLSQVRLNYTQYLKHVSLTLNTAILNLFNTNYQVIQNFPMPLRHYEIGLTIQFNKPLKQKQ